MPLASGNVPVQYMTLAGGFSGTDQTVALMRKLATGQYGSRSPKIRALAINILRKAGAPEKNYWAETVAIHNWVRDNIRYTRDVTGQETLSPPEEIAFNTKAGDCDDKSILEAALLGAVGITTRFKVLGVTPNQYSHVYLQAHVKDRWVSLDPIMREKPAGWEAPAHMRKIEKVYPENIPEGLNMRTGVNGLGYVGDPRIVSFLEEEPRNAPRYATPYVSMRSMLDNDAPIDQLSNNAPAFPQDQNIGPRMPTPRLQHVRPLLRTMKNRNASRASMNQQAQDMEMEIEAMNPGMGLHDVMLPDYIAGIGNGPDFQEGPQEYMQRPALAFTPDAIDADLGRKAMVINARAGDRMLYRGLWALNEQPPINRLVGMSGIEKTTRSMIPGMGYLAGRGMSGPGLVDASEGVPQYAPGYLADAPGISTKTMVGAAVALVGLYLLCRKK